MAIRDVYSKLQDDYAVGARRSSSAGAVSDAELPGLFTILWRRKLVILASLLLALAGGIAYVVVTPPRYLASTAMLIDPRLGKTLGSDPVQPGFIADTSAMDSQIKLFTSQTVLTRVGKMADLANDAEFNGSERSLLQRLLHPGTSLEGGVDLKALEDAVTIKRPERTYVVGIDVLAKDPKKAAAIANAITQAYIDDQVTSRVGAAQEDTSFVKQRLNDLSTQISDAENKVEAYKSKNTIVDSAGLRSNEQEVADLTRTLADARAKASDAKAQLAEVQRMARRGRLDASGGAVRSVTVERLRQEEAQTTQEVAKLATTLGPQHPALIEAKGRQAKIESLIRAELQRLAIVAKGDYQIAHSHEKDILAEVDTLKRQSTTLSRNLVPLQKLERNVQMLRASFDRFTQVDSNIAQQEAGSPPGRVISVARPPVSPASPKKTVVGIISLSAGLFFGLAAALFAESAGPRRPLIPAVFYEKPVEAAKPKPRSGRRYWDDDDDAGA